MNYEFSMDIAVLLDKDVLIYLFHFLILSSRIKNSCASQDSNQHALDVYNKHLLLILNPAESLVFASF